MIEANDILHIELTPEDRDIIKLKSGLIAEKKYNTEYGEGSPYRPTSAEALSKRWLSGLAGEYAMEKYFGSKIIDLATLSRPDLSPIGYWLGVKTSYEDNPNIIVSESFNSAQIICLLERDLSFVSVLGIADMQLLCEALADEASTLPSTIKSPVKKFRLPPEYFSRLDKFTLEELSKYKVTENWHTND